MVDRRNAISTARSGPSASTLTRQTTAIQKSERRIVPQLAQLVDLDERQHRVGHDPGQRRVGQERQQVGEEEHHQRDRPGRHQAGQLAAARPTASIAAEREGLLPVTSDPVKPAARLAAP